MTFLIRKGDYEEKMRWIKKEYKKYDEEYYD